MLPTITSTANSRIKKAVKLRNGGDRRKERKFLIDGLRETERAIASGFRMLEAYVSTEKLEEFEPFLSRFDQEKIPYWPVVPSVLERLQFGQRDEGIVVIAEFSDIPLESFPLSDCPLIAVLESIEKPGNLGAILRSADGAGIEGLILSKPRCDVFNPNTIRGSLGTVFHVPIAVDDNPIAWLWENGIQIAAAKCEGSIPYTEFDFTRPTAIVLGSEADGLGENWTVPGVTGIRLPMHGIADSLNVSVAAAILFYHARMLRGAKSAF